MLIGDKSQIASEQWSLFQKTGTIHLMAISGLHMSIMALLGFWFFKALWWLGLYRLQVITLPTLAASGAVLFATLYLFISGGSIPTQRAWIMVVTILAFLLIRRSFQPWSALSMAAFLIIAWDSKAVLSTGFWLSFYAVILIFISLQIFKDKPKWQQLIAMQITLSIGLMPLIMWNFYEIPVYGLLANLVAVPFVTFIGLPALLIGTVVGFVSLPLGQKFFIAVDWRWQQLWDYLYWLINLPDIPLPTIGHSILWLLAILLLMFVFYRVFTIFQKQRRLSPWAFQLGLLLFIVVVFVYPYNPNRAINTQEGSKAWLTVLDVGQGQAIVIETQNHVVVYDAGAKWGNKIDAAQVALLPYLKSQGWQKIDLLVISHSDMDHAGGTESVVKSLTVKQAISGQPDKLNQQLQRSWTSDANVKVKSHEIKPFTACYAGQKWQFDGVTFEMLSPFKNKFKKTLSSDNDRSCVLKVSNQSAAFLLTGDLSNKGEKVLLKAYANQPQKLQADLLVAGHHGSKSSSSEPWLKAVNPSKVVFSSGYRNRYKFPNKEVISRIEAINAKQRVKWWNTACSGGVSFELSDLGVDLRYETRKSQRKWYHHSCFQSQQGTYFQ